MIFFKNSIFRKISLFLGIFPVFSAIKWSIFEYFQKTLLLAYWFSQLVEGLAKKNEKSKMQWPKICLKIMISANSRIGPLKSTFFSH